MISNPINGFINGGETIPFIYEGGSQLYHFSPNDNNWSDYMVWNIIFHANNEEHARNILARMLEHEINTILKYEQYQCNSIHGTGDKSYKLVGYEVWLYNVRKGDVILEEVEKNQAFKAGWAHNDTV